MHPVAKKYAIENYLLALSRKLLRNNKTFWLHCCVLFVHLSLLSNHLATYTNKHTLKRTQPKKPITKTLIVVEIHCCINPVVEALTLVILCNIADFGYRLSPAFTLAHMGRVSRTLIHTHTCLMKRFYMKDNRSNIKSINWNFFLCFNARCLDKYWMCWNTFLLMNWCNTLSLNGNLMSQSV